MWLTLALWACVATDPDAPGEPSEAPLDPTGMLPSRPKPASPALEDPVPAGARIRWMLHGGGSEDDAVFAVFVEAANFGNIVTLGALPEGDPAIPAWDPYWRRLGARTATTVNTASLADGDDPALAAVVREADALFLRGGDQAAYVAQWFGHAVGDALVEAFDRGAVIGGSSAGCAILGERLYDASAGGVAAWEVLRNGRDPWLTFTDNPGFGVRGVITDTHVGERGRLPRLAVFLAHQQQDRPDVRWQGLGIDTQTALFVREDRTGFVRGDGAVTLLRSGRATLTAGRPPDLRDVALWSLPEGYAIHLDAEDPVTSRPASVIATARVPVSPFGETDLDGDWTGTNRLGSWQIEPWADPYALLDGRLQVLPADAVLPSAIVGARVWSDDETLETRLGGLLWGVAEGDGRMAIAMDEGMFAMSLEPRTLAVAPNQVALVVDARTASHRGTRATGWQVGALEGARLHLVGDAEPLDLR